MKKIFLILMMLCSNAFAAITDLKLSTAQIFDVQWYISGGILYASGFNYIYSSVNYSTQTTSAARWTAAQTSDANSNGRYIGFFNSTTNPGTYGMAVFNSDGTKYKIINNTGTFVALANGAIFYNGNGMWGTLITTGQGYNNGQSGNWSVTQSNPTNSQLQAYTPPSSTPLAAGQTAAPAAPTPNWQMIRTTSSPVVINNIYPTSNNSPSNETAVNAFDGNPNTKYLNFDKQNAGVTVKLNQGRVVKKFTITTANDAVERDPASYKLYGSNDGVNWVLLSEGPLSLSDSRFAVSGEIAVANTNPYIYYFIKFPSIKNNSGNSVQVSEVTYYYDLDDGITSTDTGTGGTPSNPGQAGSVCSDCAPSWPATSDITVNQTAQKNAAKSRVANIQLGNYVYIDQKIGSSNNSVTVEQTGNYNKISGFGGTTYSVIDGDNNTINIKQGDTLGKNLIEFSVTGNTNNITLWQARNITTGLQDGSESGGHYIGLSVSGNLNTIAIKQGNEGATDSGHFGLMNVTGNGNTMTLRQAGNGEKTAFVTVDGSNNIGSVYQYGVGSNHYADLVLTGNGHAANVTQAGTVTHKATINLTNAGGASNVTLIQQGATAQNINITQQCATLSGCSVSVTQGQ
jgi:hypothetical protein